MPDTLLRLDGLEKSFSHTKVLKGISLTVAQGEFVTLLGASGCGKTTTLRIIAGLTEPDAGRVFLAGKDITFLPPERRDVHMVFQNYALFPHMNVEKNIAYGLRLRGVSRTERHDKVEEMLRLVRLEGYGKRMPSELSGGQRQRVAIARAVVLRPKLLLLDEPLGALDLKLRQQMQMELKEIQRRLGITFVYITHDQEEALNMSDRIAVMRDGILEQVGTPEEIYEHPKTEYVAAFVGETNFLSCKVIAAAKDRLTVEHGSARFPARRDGLAVSVGDVVQLCLRVERMRIAKQPEGECSLRCTMGETRYGGGSVWANVRLESGQVLRVQCPSVANLAARMNEKAYVCWNAEDAAVVRGAGV